MLQIKIDRKIIEMMARAAHIENFAKYGDRYATRQEMDMHLEDPCAFWSLVKDQIEKALGADYHGQAFDDFIKAPFDDFIFVPKDVKNLDGELLELLNSAGLWSVDTIHDRFWNACGLITKKERQRYMDEFLRECGENG